MINSRQNADLWGARKLVPGDESFCIERSLSRGKRDRDPKSVKILSERRNLHAYREKKVALAFQGACATQMRLSGAEAEMDRRNREQRKADIALYETNRELALSGDSMGRSNSKRKDQFHEVN